MLIIIEGVDRTGKSTLAETICKIADAKLVHSSKPSGHPLETYEGDLMSYDPRRDRLVLDRWHIGERVWPTIFGRESEYDMPMFKHTEMFLRSRGAVVVYAERTDHEQWARELAEFNEPINGVTGAHARHLFDEALVQRYWNEQSYNFHKDNVHHFARTITKRAEREARDSAKILDVTTEYVGSMRPRTLLIGERQNDGPGAVLTSPNLPFVPYRGTSGHFMWDDLEYWQDLGACNATKKDGTPENLVALWRALGRPTVVALGKKAAARANEELCEFLDVREIPHPQYVRRFKRAEGHGYYARLLKEAIA